MQEVIVDCSGLAGAEQVHDAFAKALAFPGWYGKNLDALYDCLTAIGEETHICIRNFEDLGVYRAGFRRVLEDACQTNPRLKLIFV